MGSPLLLDTQVVIWALDGNPRLESAAREAIRRASERYFSAISQLEITIKVISGRLHVPGDFAVLAHAQGLTHLDFSVDDAAALTALPERADHDPFDRALLAQAQNRRFDFMTADRRLLALGLPWVVDAGA